MKYLWAFLMVLGLVVAPSGQDMSIGWCVFMAITGLAIGVFAGERFIREMERDGK